SIVLSNRFPKLSGLLINSTAYRHALLPTVARWGVNYGSLPKCMIPLFVLQQMQIAEQSVGAVEPVQNHALDDERLQVIKHSAVDRDHQKADLQRLQTIDHDAREKCSPAQAERKDSDGQENDRHEQCAKGQRLGGVAIDERFRERDGGDNKKTQR